MSQAGLARVGPSNLPPSVPLQFTGDGGTIAVPVGNNITIFSNNAFNNSGSTVKFTNSGATSTFNVTDSLQNTMIGKLSGNAALSSLANTCIGYSSGNNFTSDQDNCFLGAFTGLMCSASFGNIAIGYATFGTQTTCTGTNNVAIGGLSMSYCTTGFLNVAIGESSLSRLTTGDNNIAIGNISGVNYLGPETSNICIANRGVGGESNVIRIGTQGGGDAQQNTCFIAGITGVNPANPQIVTINGSTGQMGVVSPTANSVLTTNNASIPTYIPLTNGQVLIGSSTGAPIAGTLTAGAGIAITNAANSITIAVVDQGFTWNNITGTSANMVKENGYEANNAGLVTLTLPTTASSTFGDRIAVMGLGSGGWKIAQLAGQQIQFGSSATTVGVGGSLSSNSQWSNLEIVYSTTSGLWIVMSSIGNITVT